VKSGTKTDYVELGGHPQNYENVSCKVTASSIFDLQGTLSQIFLDLPAFAECPVWKDEDECEKSIRLRFSTGGYASAGFAEAVKMPRAEAWGASLLEISGVSPVFPKLPLG